MVEKFQQNVANMGIIIKNPLVETHHSMDIIEYYHGSARQIYSIITAKIPGMKPNLALQIFFKTINNLLGLNEQVFTLFVFGAYPKMTKKDVLSLSITQRVHAIQKTINEFQKCIVFQQIDDVLNFWNSICI